MKCAVAFLIRFLTLCNTSCMLKGSLAHMASSSIGCTPSEITIKKNRYGFINVKMQRREFPIIRQSSFGRTR